MHHEIQVLRTGGQLDKIDDRWTQGGLGHLGRTDAVRRDHPVGARAEYLASRVLVLCACDYVQVGSEQPSAEHGVHVLSVRADGRDQTARSIDSDPAQYLLLAGIGLDGDHAQFQRGLHAGRVALDHHARCALAEELSDDDAPDATKSADDEVIVQFV